jgi:hypothetical protein
MTNAISEICSAFRTRAACDHASSLRSDWGKLRAARLDLSTEDKATLMKKKLALRILVSATAGGVQDFETFKQQALRSLGGRFRSSVSEAA